jgi:outer membrane protein assembly factor BamE (lipoprotein component of BamABCDE complex)
MTFIEHSDDEYKTMTTTIQTATALALVLSLSACAPMIRRTPPVGAPLAEVTAKLGKPDAVYPAPDGGQVLEYRGQPMGQFQYMARIGADGRLLSYDQVLTTENFANVKVGSWNKDDVLRHFGRPAEVTRYRLEEGEIWSYRYKEQGVWNSEMNVDFNARGAVLRMFNTPDPLLDDRFKGP